jgi:hypothetical protein
MYVTVTVTLCMSTVNVAVFPCLSTATVTLCMSTVTVTLCVSTVTGTVFLCMSTVTVSLCLFLSLSHCVSPVVGACFLWASRSIVFFPARPSGQYRVPLCAPRSREFDMCVIPIQMRDSRPFCSRPPHGLRTYSLGFTF